MSMKIPEINPIFGCCLFYLNEDDYGGKYYKGRFKAIWTSSAG